MGKKKKEKRSVTFYKIAFGFTPTFQVIVHPEVIKQCISQQINLRDTLPKVLYDNAVPCTTKCIINHLRNTEDVDHIGSAVMARKFKMISCSHQKVKTLSDDHEDQDATDDHHSMQEDNNQFLSPEACISDILEKTRSANSHSIAVALSISYPVKISRERFYNIPFIQLNNSPYTFTILPIADKAHKKSKQKEKKQREIPEHEKNIVNSQDEISFPIAGKKRKRKSAPNPLSMRKRKKPFVIPPEKPKVGPKRKTRRKKKKKFIKPTESTETTESNNSNAPSTTEAS